MPGWLPAGNSSLCSKFPFFFFSKLYADIGTGDSAAIGVCIWATDSQMNSDTGGTPVLEV